MEKQLKELVKKAVDGDQEAIGKIVEQKYDNIFYFAVSQTNYQDAKDISQNVIIHIYNSIGTLKNIDKFQAWLMGTVYHECLNYMKKARRNLSELLAPPFEEMDSSGGGSKVPMPEDLVINEEVREMVIDCLKSLPKSYGTCLTLYYLYGLSRTEIAGVLGVNIKKVYNDLNRGRKQLKDAIEKKGGKNYIYSFAPAGLFIVLPQILKADMISYGVSSSAQIAGTAGIGSSAGVGLAGKLASFIVVLSTVAAGAVLINNYIPDKPEPRTPSSATQAVVAEEARPPSAETPPAEPEIHTLADMIGADAAARLEAFVTGDADYETWDAFIQEIGAQEQESSAEPENIYVKYVLEKQTKRLIIAKRQGAQGVRKAIYLFGEKQEEMPRMMEIILMFED